MSYHQDVLLAYIELYAVLVAFDNFLLLMSINASKLSVLHHQLVNPTEHHHQLSGSFKVSGHNPETYGPGMFFEVYALSPDQRR